MSLDSRPLCWCKSRMDSGPADGRLGRGEADGASTTRFVLIAASFGDLCRRRARADQGKQQATYMNACCAGRLLTQTPSHGLHLALSLERPDLREPAEPKPPLLRVLPLVLALSGATPTASYSLRRSQELLLDLVALPYTSCKQRASHARTSVPGPASAPRSPPWGVHQAACRGCTRGARCAAAATACLELGLQLALPHARNLLGRIARVGRVELRERGATLRLRQTVLEQVVRALRGVQCVGGAVVATGAGQATAVTAGGLRRRGGRRQQRAWAGAGVLCAGGHCRRAGGRHGGRHAATGGGRAAVGRGERGRGGEAPGSGQCQLESCAAAWDQCRKGLAPGPWPIAACRGASAGRRPGRRGGRER